MTEVLEHEENTASNGLRTSPDTSFTSGICFAFGRFGEGLGFVAWGELMVSSSPSDSTGFCFDFFFGEDVEAGSLDVEGPGSVSSRSESTSS